MPISRPSMTIPFRSPIFCCAATIAVRTKGMTLTGLTLSDTRMERISRSTSIPFRNVCHTRFGIGAEIDLNVVHEGPQRIGIDRVAVDETVVEAVEGDGAVHCATVDINVAYVPARAFAIVLFPHDEKPSTAMIIRGSGLFISIYFLNSKRLVERLTMSVVAPVCCCARATPMPNMRTLISAAYAESAEKVTVSGAHVGVGFVVVPPLLCKCGRWEGEPTPKMRWREKVVHELAFFDDFVAPGVRAAFDGGIGKFPPCEVTSGDRHPYGRMFEALRIAYLQIERHAFESVVVTFDLSTQIACYQ